MNNHPYHDILAARGAYLCVECGKCVALCPMAETSLGFSRDKSPRGTVQQALRGVPVENMPGLTSCLQCRSCSNTCPAGIDVAGLIADLRKICDTATVPYCTLCGSPLLPEDATRWLRREVEHCFEEELDYVNLCPSCRRKAYIRNNS